MEKETKKVELSALKIEQLNKQPILETSIQMSEDKNNRHQTNELHGESNGL